MFYVHEADAVAIRTAFDQGGEFSAGSRCRCALGVRSPGRSRGRLAAPHERHETTSAACSKPRDRRRANVVAAGDISQRLAVAVAAPDPLAVPVRGRLGVAAALYDD